jgi:hypothetical protein
MVIQLCRGITSLQSVVAMNTDRRTWKGFTATRRGQAAQGQAATWEQTEIVHLVEAVDTSLRNSEICDLHVDGIRSDYVLVRGKGDKEREIGITPTTAKYLWKYLKVYTAVLLILAKHTSSLVGAAPR